MPTARRLLLLGVYALLLLAIVVSWWQTNFEQLETGLAPALVALSRLSALLGTFSVLVQFILISRAPWLEPAAGFDRLTRLHRYNGLAAFTLITAHIILIISGNALLRGVSLPAQFQELVTGFPYVWLALIAYILLLVTIATSIVIVRRQLRYESWYLVHLFNYCVILLAIWHQVAGGLTLVSNDWLRHGWYALHGLVLLNLIIYRFWRPIKLQIKHRFKVEKIAPETADVSSIYVTGRRLDQFKYNAGQFNKWRFLQAGFWGEEHPFTISIEPNGKFLRLTPKKVGDYTARMGNIKPGTPVIISGPLGTFSLNKTDNQKLLLIAGGIGITPLRAMMGEAGPGYDITLLYACRKQNELVLREELEKIAYEKNFKIEYVLSDEKTAGFHHGRVDSQLLRKAVPDLLERSVYICGPPAMMESVSEELESLGVERTAIYTERFSL